MGTPDGTPAKTNIDLVHHQGSATNDIYQIERIDFWFSKFIGYQFSDFVVSAVMDLWLIRKENNRMHIYWNKWFRKSMQIVLLPNNKMREEIDYPYKKEHEMMNK